MNKPQTHLLDLSNELLLSIFEELHSLHDVYSLLQTNRRILSLALPTLHNLAYRTEPLPPAPIIWAAINGHQRMLSYLLSKGPQITIGSDASTILHQTPSRCDDIVLEKIIGVGPNLHICERPGRRKLWDGSALHWATKAQHKKIVKRLLEKGADVNAGDKNGNTALFHAAGLGDVVLCEVLLEGGADVTMLNVKDQSPSDWAVMGWHVELAKWLVSKGCRGNVGIFCSLAAHEA